MSAQSRQHVPYKSSGYTKTKFLKANTGMINDRPRTEIRSNLNKNFNYSHMTWFLNFWLHRQRYSFETRTWKNSRLIFVILAMGAILQMKKKKCRADNKHKFIIRTSWAIWISETDWVMQFIEDKEYYESELLRIYFFNFGGEK